MESQPDLAEDTGEAIKTPITTLQALLTNIAKQHLTNIALICKHQPPDFLGQT